MYHNSWIEISKKNLVHNIKLHRKFLGSDTKLIAVVKSNAYGHGMVIVSKILDTLNEVDIIATVNLEEAIELRNNKIKKSILVLSYFGILENRGVLVEQVICSIKNDISLMIYDLKTAKFLNSVAKKLNKKIKVHIKIETGMTRVGVLYDEAISFIKNVSKLKSIEIIGLASHFATTEEANQYFTKQQLNNFEMLIKNLEKANIVIPIKHIACSAAITLSENNHFDAVRLGIAMYGLWPSFENKNLIKKQYSWFDLRPVLSWKTKLFQIKRVGADTPVGYGCTYRTKRATKIGLIPVGYFEGLDRGFSNNGYVLVGGKKCSIIGRVCMNITIIDLNSVKNAVVGDDVVLIGKQLKNYISAEELADRIGTINYEITTRLNSNTLRVIKND